MVLPFKDHGGAGDHMTRCCTGACVLDEDWFFQIIHLSRGNINSPSPEYC